MGSQSLRVFRFRRRHRSHPASRMVSGYESRSSPYPPAKVFLAQFGTVSDWSYPEALARLSQLSFSS